MNDTSKNIRDAFDLLMKLTPSELAMHYGLAGKLAHKLQGECGKSFAGGTLPVRKGFAPCGFTENAQRYADISARADRVMWETAAAGKAAASSAGVTAKAAYYRALAGIGDMAAVCKTYTGLGAIPAVSEDLGRGSNLLPTTMSNELLAEPVEENSLRRVEPVSQIPGLEEPKIDFTIEDSNLADVTDEETAREIKMEGDTISYGRFKTKIVATVKDTVLHGTDTDLVNKVEAALRSGLAIKEKINAFRAVSDTKHDHMSFYLNSIKEVEGADLIQAIINAWADLPEAFAANARCVMRKQDYYAAIRTLANSSNDLWGAAPEDVLGIPVVFNDRAVTPVVGDFRYSRQNYDIGAVMETDKDGKKGEYYFILTAWGDHRIRLKNAFRLAKVKEAADEG